MNYNTNFNTTPYYPYNVQPSYNQTQQYSYLQNQQQNDGSMMAVLINGGEASANAYPVALGGSVILLDFDLGKMFLKSNVNGIPQKLRSFSFTEDQQSQSQSQSQSQQQLTQNSEFVTHDEFTTLSQNVSSLTESVNKLLVELGGNTNE